MLTECPNCGESWGFEEIDWQQCDCCGWPDNDDDYDEDDWGYDDDEDNVDSIKIDKELFAEFLQNYTPNKEQ